MPQSIEQNSTGAGAIQIGHVEGNVIIQLSRVQAVDSAGRDRRDFGFATAAGASTCLGVSLATPDMLVQLATFLIASVLTIVSGIAFVASRRTS